MEKFIDALCAVLFKRDLLDKKELESLKKGFEDSPKEYFDEFLLEEGFVSKPDLLSSLAQVYNVESFDVKGFFFKTHLLHMFPKGFLLRNGVIPSEVDGNVMVVVASIPDASGLESSIREFVSYDIAFRVGIRLDIQDAVKEYYDKSLTQVQTDVDSRQERRIQEGIDTCQDNRLAKESVQLDENIEEFAEEVEVEDK